MPTLNRDLQKTEASYESASGRYACSWELLDDDHVRILAEVPFNCTATMALPRAKEELYHEDNPMFADVRDGICYLEPGKYTVTYELSESVRKVYSIDTPVCELYANEKTAEIVKTVHTTIAIPEMYMNYSLRELSEKFSTRIPAEKLPHVDELLRRV